MFQAIDAVLLYVAKKGVKVWSSVTGKTNFALARGCVALAGVTLMTIVLSDIASGSSGAAVFHLVMWPLVLLMVWHWYINPLEKEAQRQDYSENPAYSPKLFASERSASFLGLFYFAFFVFQAVLVILDVAAGAPEEAFKAFLWMQLVGIVSASLYAARAFDKGGKSRAKEWVTAIAKKLVSLVPKPAPTPVPIPSPVQG